MSFFSSLSDIHLGKLSLSSILSAIVIFIICLIAIRIISTFIKKAMEKSKLEKGLKSFIGSAVRIGLWAIAIIVVAGSLGIDTASLVAVLSVAGLALSLAVQGIAANLFSGVTISPPSPSSAATTLRSAASRVPWRASACSTPPSSPWTTSASTCRTAT